LLLCSSYLALGVPNCLAIIIIINYTPAISGLSFSACGFLAFGASSSAIFFGGMVVEGERRSCNYGGMADFGGENEYMRCILEGN
jgi:hypothetical protein